MAKCCVYPEILSQPTYITEINGTEGERLRQFNTMSLTARLNLILLVTAGHYCMDFVSADRTGPVEMPTLAVKCFVPYGVTLYGPDQALRWSITSGSLNPHASGARTDQVADPMTMELKLVRV